MDSKGSVVKGGLSIKHQLHEGKHQYEVENSFKFKKANGEGKGGFARKGDKLLLVNGVNLQELTPEQFALMLTKGNPMLTVHQAQKKGPTDHLHSSEDTFKPVSKEKTQLSFSLEMKREEDLGQEEDWSEQGVAGQGEEEVFQSGDVANRKEGDFLVVTLRKTSISVIKGRGPATGGHCHDCSGSECAFNDVVMVSESSSVILVPRGGGSGSFKCEKQRDISIEHVVTQQYLSSLCLQQRPFVSPNPENITIYYYKSDSPERVFRGIPVVLNFTDSNCFLKCSKDGERVLLCVETCNKNCLKQISRSDASTLSFVFYMKSTRDRQRRFESALCPGWFIHIVTDIVSVEEDRQADDPAFFFIIR